MTNIFKKIKLIDWFHRQDFGDEYGLQIIKTKKYSLIQTSVSWSEFASGPYFHVSMGQGRILGLIFFAYKFGFDLDIMTHTWIETHSQSDNEEQYDYTELV